MDKEMMNKLEEVRSLLLEPEAFNKLVAKYEVDPSEENLREVIDLVTIELAKGRLKGLDNQSK